MSAAMRSDFVESINQICAERGIDSGPIFSALEEAVLAAWKKDHTELDAENVTVEINRESGEIKLVVAKDVVAEVEDKETQISLKEAQKLNEGLTIGDQVELESAIKGFGRIATQVAKQVILQKLKDAEKDAALDRYVDNVGGIVSGTINRVDRRGVHVDLEKATALMPNEEQIPSEFYELGKRYKFLLKEIVRDEEQKEIILSRASSAFLEELFKLEVPEINSGAVEIKGCVRSPGVRSKIAVHSLQEGIDAIGACVGQRGSRIEGVQKELGGVEDGERVDIILWEEELEDYVTSSFSPAKIKGVHVEYDKENNPERIEVDVSKDQLPLAIGREGVNVDLVSRLLGGVTVDVNKGEDESEVKKSETEENQDADVKKVTPKGKKSKVKDVEKKVQTKEEKSQKRKNGKGLKSS